MKNSNQINVPQAGNEVHDVFHACYDAFHTQQSIRSLELLLSYFIVHNLYSDVRHSEVD